MKTSLATTHSTPVAVVEPFDTAHILAGQVSANTQKQYISDFEKYLDFAGSRDAALQPETLSRWRQAMFQDGYTLKDGTQKDYTVAAINRRLSSVRSVMKEAAQQGLVTHELAESFRNVKGLKLKSNKTRRKENTRTRITVEQMNAICNAPNEYASGEGARLLHRALLLTMRYTGARISEVVNMQQSHIVWHTNDVGISGWAAQFLGKNETEPAVVELGTKAKEAIDVWLRYRRDLLGVDVQWIFTGFGGRGDRNPSDTPMSRVSAWETVKRYTEYLGLEHVKPHDFRRYVGTKLAEKDIRLAQKQLRHKNLETTARNYVLDDVPLGHMDAL